MILNCIEKRRSIRKYTNEKVSKDQIERILEAAIMAPSGNNSQPWKFLVITDDSKRGEISEVAHRQKWMTSAPVFIVGIADMKVRHPDEFIPVDEDSSEENLKKIIRDTSIALEHVALQAVEEGLSTCWIAWYRQNEMRKVLNIPDDKYIVSILILGYSSENPNPRPRKKIEDLVLWETWQE